MPDPLPSTTQPRSSGSLVNPTLARLHAPHNNFRDDMEVFSPIVEVQSFDKLWETHASPEKNIIPSRRFGLSGEAADHENPISNTTVSKQVYIPIFEVRVDEH